MNKSYVIMVPFWDYNDEYSFTVGQDEGSPVAAFTNSETAKKRCDELDISGWRFNIAGESIGGWMYGPYTDMPGSIDEDEAIAKLKAAFFNKDEEECEIDLNDFLVPVEITDEQIKVLREVFGWIYFAHVVEVDLE